MKSLVLYYSQSGNTEKVAKAIQNGIRSATGQCDITFLKLKETKVSSLQDYDLIGIGAPAFGFKEPGNVAVFLKQFGPLAGKDSFIFTTHAGHPGNILPSMEAKLKRAGLRLLGGFGCDGQYFMPSRFTPWFTDGHPDETDLKQAADFGREMVDKKAKVDKGKHVPEAHFPWLRGGIYHDVWVANEEGKHRKVLTFDREKCAFPKCRRCMENCPADCINVAAEPIVLQGKGCIHCYFCEQVCPTGAINYPEGYLAFANQWFKDLIHKYKYPEWYKIAETKVIEHRGSLYRRVGAPVDIEDLNKAAFRVLPQRPRVPKNLIAGR